MKLDRWEVQNKLNKNNVKADEVKLPVMVSMYDMKDNIDLLYHYNKFKCSFNGHEYHREIDIDVEKEISPRTRARTCNKQIRKLVLTSEIIIAFSAWAIRPVYIRELECCDTSVYMNSSAHSLISQAMYSMLQDSRQLSRSKIEKKIVSIRQKKNMFSVNKTKN